ncbi:MAG: YebC/PmpR family DNA-binding transcriptional regulator [Patescibacteria group bacterium]
MSGHSHSHNIKRAKDSTDAKRAKEFTKVSRLIIVATKKGGGDPNSNSSLRLAMEKARGVNMPRENIDRAIKRALGIAGESGEMHELRYEGYGPEGVALMIDVVTDNKNRTLAEVRQTLNKFGGSLGEPGCASYIFGNDPQNPRFRIPVADNVKAKILELVEELEDNDDVQDVFYNLEE